MTTNSNYFSTDTVDESGYSLMIQSISDVSETNGGDVLLINNSSSTNAGYVSTFDGSAFTVSMWVKSLDTAWTKWDEIANKQIENWGSSPNYGWSVRSEVGTMMRFNSYEDPAPGSVSAISTSDALDGSWHGVTATYDGNTETMSIYIDGQLEGTTNAVISDASLYSLAFGARADGSRGENVLIDEIQYYDEVLSADEIFVLMSPHDELIVTPNEIALELVAPATTITGSVAGTYISDSDVQVSVSISDSTHPEAFSVLFDATQTLTEPYPSSTLFEFEFDNSVAGLVGGETATGLVTFAWNLVGDAEVREIQVPISVFYPNEDITIEELGGSPVAVNPLDLTAEGTTDWVMLGQGGSISNRDEKVGADYIGAVTVVGTHDAYAANAYLSGWTDGSPTDSASGAQGGWEVKPPAVDGKQALTFSVDGLTPGGYTMKMYCSRYRATGTLTASTGAESFSADFDEGGVGSGSNYGFFTLNFPVASQGESLDVSLDVSALGHTTYGNVSITAISLAKTSNPDATVGEISIEMISDGTEVALSWDTSYGALYGVMATENITHGPWGNIITDVAGTGSEVTVTNSLPGNAEFFRAYIQD